MSQRNIPRVDRFAQMSRQEELIARKRLEIQAKQRTAELARAVAAAQSLAAELKSSPAQPVSEGASSPITTTSSLLNSGRDLNESLGHPLGQQPPPPPPPISTQPSTTKVVISTSASTSTSALNSKGSGNRDNASMENIESQSHSIMATTQSTIPKSSPATLMGKTGRITSTGKRMNVMPPTNEQPPSKIQNNFCNDGSFLENFKKILEKQQQEIAKQQQQQLQLMNMIKASNTTQAMATSAE